MSKRIRCEICGACIVSMDGRVYSNGYKALKEKRILSDDVFITACEECANNEQEILDKGEQIIKKRGN